MRKLSTLISFEKSIYFFIITFLFLFVIRTPIIYFPDSKGYLAMTIYRSCGYSFFLETHQYLFGSYFESALIFSQCILNTACALYLTSCFRRTVALDKWLAIVLFILLLFPVFLGILTANTVLSESLAYPLYLLIIGKVMMGFHSKKHIHFYAAALITLVLILVRGQFLFLIPVLIAAAILTYYKSLFSIRNFLLMGFIILIPILSILIDIGFHKIKHNQAVTTPLTGIQIITIPFFVADENDYTIFETKEQQDYFKYVYSKLKEKKLLRSQLPSNGKEIEFFFENYVSICNLTIAENGMETFAADKTIEEKYILNDKLTSLMTLPLLKQNFKKWFKVYSANFMKGFDTSKYFLLYLIVLILSGIQLLKKENVTAKVCVFLSLLTIANVALTATAESTIGRYTFYNNWILFAIFLLFFQSKFYRETHE